MQRMMEMQQARMQQLQQMQQNAMLFGQQRAAFAAATTPLGTMGGGALSGGMGQGPGGPRQSFLGLSLAASGGLFGLGESRGLFGTGIGNQLNFRFSDPSRDFAQRRAQQELQGVGRGIGRELFADSLNAVGLDFLNRKFGLAGQGSVIEDSLAVMDSFSGIRGAREARVGGVGVSRGFAVDTLRNLRAGISGRFSAMGDDEVRTLSTAALDTLSLGQRSALAQGTRQDADKALMDQVDLLKKISENTKMSVDEIKEVSKAAKGQTAGSPLQLVQRAASFAGSMETSTDMTRGELTEMALGFRRSALDLGATGAGADRMQRSMFRTFERTLERFNAGQIDDGTLFAYGGSTPEEAAQLRAMALARQGSRLSRATVGTMGLLDDPIAAMRGGMAGFVGAQARAIADDPYNAAANARYSEQGIRRSDARTASAQLIAVEQARMLNRQMGGRLNESSMIGIFANALGIDDPRKARDQYLELVGAEDKLRTQFGDDFDRVTRSLSASDAQILAEYRDRAGADVGQVLSSVERGSSFEAALRASVGGNYRNLNRRRDLLASAENQGLTAQDIFNNLPAEAQRKIRESGLKRTTRVKVGEERSRLTPDMVSVFEERDRSAYDFLYDENGMQRKEFNSINSSVINEAIRTAQGLTSLTVLNANTAPTGSMHNKLHVITYPAVTE